MKKIICILLCLTMIFTFAACGGSNENSSESSSKAFTGKSTKSQVGESDINSFLSTIYPEGTEIIKIHDVTQEKGDNDQRLKVTCSADTGNEYCSCTTNWTINFERLNDVWNATEYEMGLYQTTMNDTVDFSPFIEEIKELLATSTTEFPDYNSMETVYNKDDGTIGISFGVYTFSQYEAKNTVYVASYQFNGYPYNLEWSSMYLSEDETKATTYNIWGLAGHYYCAGVSSDEVWECDVEKVNGKYISKNYSWARTSYGTSGTAPDFEITRKNSGYYLVDSQGTNINLPPLSTVSIKGDTMYWYSSSSIVDNNLPLDLTDIPEELWDDAIAIYGATSYVVGDNIQDNYECLTFVENDKSLDDESHSPELLSINVSLLKRRMKYSGSDTYSFEIIYDINNNSNYEMNEFYGYLYFFNGNGDYLTELPLHYTNVVIPANSSNTIDTFIDLDGEAAAILYSDPSNFTYTFNIEAIEYADGYKLSHLMM